MYKKQSYWEQNAFLKDINLVIIGSGIVGISAAIAYQERFPNRRIVVLERGCLPTGASTKNAGFACFGSLSELVADMESYGEQLVLDLVRKRWTGLQRLRSKVGDINMNYEAHGGYELFLDEQEAKNAANYLSFFNDRLYTITGIKKVFSLSDNSKRFGFGKPTVIIENKAEGQLHPAKMMKALIQQARSMGITILNGCELLHFEEKDANVQLFCNSFDCTASQVLFATNGFTPRLLPTIDLQPARNQVLLTAPISNLKLKGTFHFNQGYYYFRNVGNRVLLGGARNMAQEAESTDEFGHTPLIQNALNHFLQEVILPNQSIKIDHIWSGILGVGPTKYPIIKKISDRIVVAVRMGGMGVAIGTLVGEEGASLLE